ncbi:hypothetical protein [Dokdonella soli]|uniref:Uncharacterized protein n=1 Tax=Dokdonella soli TaxID=529810 RepID=A0ABN1IE56_9GAMM
MDNGAWVLAAAVLCASEPTFAAQPANLLPNGDFSAANQINGWTTFPYGIWSADDAGGSSSSGSIQLTGDPTESGVSAQSTCFAVSPGAAYSEGLQSKVFKGSISGAYGAALVCTTYTDANCSKNYFDLSRKPQPSYATYWTAWQTASGTLPGNARSAHCTLYLNLIGTMRFDNVFFNSIAPTAPVSLESFEVD